MKRKEITIEEYKKLKDCVITPRIGQSRKSKVVKVNKRTTRIAELYKGSVLQILYRNEEVTTF